MHGGALVEEVDVRFFMWKVAEETVLRASSPVEGADVVVAEEWEAAVENFPKERARGAGDSQARRTLPAAILLR